MAGLGFRLFQWLSTLLLFLMLIFAFDSVAGWGFFDVIPVTVRVTIGVLGISVSFVAVAHLLSLGRRTPR